MCNNDQLDYTTPSAEKSSKLSLLIRTHLDQNAIMSKLSSVLQVVKETPGLTLTATECDMIRDMLDALKERKAQLEQLILKEEAAAHGFTL